MIVMVYAFILHTLLPGQCKVIYYQLYSVAHIEEGGEDNNEDVKLERKQQIEYAASQVHSEYAFRRSTSNRTIEEEVLALNQEDQLPEFEIGYIRLPVGEPFDKEMVAVWLGVGNTGFTLVCYKDENRVQAESVLKLIIRYCQEHLRVLQQPAEASLKAEKMCLILNKFLPDGTLVFMNHRVVRGIEKKLEILMKT